MTLLFLLAGFLVAILATTTTAVDGRFLYVTSQGDDSNDCLDVKTSCRSLAESITRADRNDVIIIDSSSYDRSDTDWLCSEGSVLIQKSISIVGSNPGTTLGCHCTGPGKPKLLTITITGTNIHDVFSVRFERLTLDGIEFGVSNASLILVDVTMMRVKWTRSDYIGLHATDVTLTGTPGVGDVFVINASRLDMTSRDFRVLHATLHLFAGSVNMTMSRGTFANVDGRPHTQGGLLVVVGEKDGVSDILIEDTRFERQYNGDPIKAVRNLNEAALKVYVKEFSPAEVPRVSLTISRCQFVNNERGLALVGNYTRVEIRSCSFTDNLAMHGGAGILLFTQNNSIVNISNCSFAHNAAGAYREDIVRDYADSFVVTPGGHEVKINSTCDKGSGNTTDGGGGAGSQAADVKGTCGKTGGGEGRGATNSTCGKGVISFVGKGGALRILRGNASLILCSFRLNRARLLGGAVFVDRDGQLMIDGVDFENSNSALPSDHPLEGELIYSNGVVVIRRATMRVLSAFSHVSVLCHSGAFWSIEVIDIEVVCPVGYRLRVTDTSAYKITSVGIIKSHKLDQLTYFCESCPRNNYSLDNGYLNQSLRFSHDSYYTLLINGSAPTLVFNGSYDHHEIICQQCPYGGKCLQGISAVPNFWGYVTEEFGVRFQRCPKGYCCSSDDCRGFDSCREHRVGTLCGVCEDGYSEAIFTADCVHNAFCDPSIGYPVVAFSCILYFIFLLYQKDMRDLMFSQIVRASDVTKIREAEKKLKERNRELKKMLMFKSGPLHSVPETECNMAASDRRFPLKSEPLETTTGAEYNMAAGNHKSLPCKSESLIKNTAAFDITDRVLETGCGFFNDGGESARCSKNDAVLVDFGPNDVTINEDGRCDETNTEPKLSSAITSCDVNELISVDNAAASNARHTYAQETSSIASCALPPAGTTQPADMGVSFLIIIFFYFQDAQLLHIKTAFTSADNRHQAMFRELLSGLFQFRVEVFQFMDKFCFLADMTALKKILVRVGMVPCVLAQFGVVHLLYMFTKWRHHRRRRYRQRHRGENTTSQSTEPELPKRGPSFSVKLATGFVLALLFTYQQLATTSFTLLNCVTVEQRSVLFVQGTIDCYQSWQYGVMAYAGSCIVPFCLVLLIGPGLLKDDLIELREFFVACLLPLPFLVRWCLIRYGVSRRTGGSGEVLTDRKRPMAAETKSVIQILQGPFKEQQIRFFGSICGQGLLIGRRLLLVLLYTFVNDTLIRMLCIMMLCFIILLHHVHALPYKDTRGNAAGSVSAACLLILGAINLLRAGFEAAEYVPQGPDAELMHVLDEIENLLILWLPGVVMGFVIITLTIKISALCFHNFIAAVKRVQTGHDGDGCHGNRPEGMDCDHRGNGEHRREDENGADVRRRAASSVLTADAANSFDMLF